jgi:hypothetical protein
VVSLVRCCVPYRNITPTNEAAVYSVTIVTMTMTFAAV